MEKLRTIITTLALLMKGDKIPYEKMLEDDLLWFKDVLAGYKILGNVKFSPEIKMLSHKFSRVNSTEEIMDIKKHWEETTSSLFCALARFK